MGNNPLTPLGASYIAPQVNRIGPAIADLLAFATRPDIPLLAQIAVVHAQSETIHPFVDGNGRVGRALVHDLLR